MIAPTAKYRTKFSSVQQYTPGPHLSSWIQTDLCVNHSYEHLHQKFSIHENPVNLDERSYHTSASECVKED